MLLLLLLQSSLQLEEVCTCTSDVQMHKLVARSLAEKDDEAQVSQLASQPATQQQQ